MSQVNTALGRSATATISLNETAVRTLAGVSTTSGTTISMDNLRGKSAVTYRLDSGNYLDFAIGVDAQTTLTVGSNGELAVTTWNSGIPAFYNWITPTTGSTTHFVRMTPTSGSFNGSSVGVWLPLTNNQAWNVYQGWLGLTMATGTLAISTNSAGTNIVASATITLRAQVDI